MADKLSDVPASFKPIQHYLKTASEQDSRDPVVAYYCRLYAMQKGMEIDKKSPECREFLRNLMTYLEQMKTHLSEHESITTELVGQAHVEDFAFKLFIYADTEDRKGNAGKNVVKAFYTSSMLFDVLTTFGELSEEVDKCRRYAKWKAAYIHNCLKVGSTPHPGPLPEAAEELGISADHQFNQPKRTTSPTNQAPPPTQPFYPSPTPPPSQPHYTNHPTNHDSATTPNYPNTSFLPPTNEAVNQAPTPSPASRNHPPTTVNFSNPPAPSTSLRPETFAQAIKFCKYANSALQYEDAPTAISNLSKALALLTQAP